MKIKKALFVGLGTLALVLGCIGVVLPILPTAPFLMVTLYCYGRSSERLHRWFTGTKLYKKNLESFVQKRGMTMKTKLSIIGTVSLLMAIGLFMMRGVPVGQVCLAIVWVCHLLYFALRVKTLPATSSDPILEAEPQ